jgi:septum formation protein
VLRLAREKAAARAAPGELVLGADTIVVLDGELLGKPNDAAHARAMLARIAGREHTVHTGVALHQPEVAEAGSTGARNAVEVETSRVLMAALDPERIAWYVESGEPLDKAGSYAVQGVGGLFVESIEGNYSNVVGLPLPLTRRLFACLGYEILDFRG